LERYDPEAESRLRREFTLQIETYQQDIQHLQEQVKEQVKEQSLII
jgi:hypothetical protein